MHRHTLMYADTCTYIQVFAYTYFTVPNKGGLKVKYMYNPNGKTILCINYNASKMFQMYFNSH